MESYLHHVTIVKHRFALTRLRLSCHNLKIEVSRYHRPRVILFINAPAEHAKCLRMKCILYVCAQDSLLYGWSSSLLSLFIILHLPCLVLQINSIIY